MCERRKWDLDAWLPNGGTWVQLLFLQGWIYLNVPSSSHCSSALIGPFLYRFTGQPVSRQHSGTTWRVLGCRAVDMEMNWDGNNFLKCQLLATPLFYVFTCFYLDEKLLKCILPAFRFHLTRAKKVKLLQIVVCSALSICLSAGGPGHCCCSPWNHSAGFSRKSLILEGPP